jgi:hypothetical protein
MIKGRGWIGLGRTATHLNEPPFVALKANHFRESGSCHFAQNNAPRKRRIAKAGMKSVIGRKTAHMTDKNFTILKRWI